MDPDEGEWHLIAWNFRTGEFELISTGRHEMWEVVVAPGLVDLGRL